MLAVWGWVTVWARAESVDPVPTSSPARATPYLAAVRTFADLALEHGRDRYGRPTPLFIDGLDVDTLMPVRWKGADGKEWVLCNLANQQGLLRVLDGLTTLTGEGRYKQAALESLRYAFDHLRYGTQHNGGLLAWGGQLAYNATDDVLAGNPGGTGRVHELKCFLPHYSLMWEANPTATKELLENLWSAHVLDWGRLDFDRQGEPRPRGVLWANEVRGGEVFFWGKGLTFHNAGSDLYFAAGMLSKLSGDSASLAWARRLSSRYAETRNPRTGLEGFQFSQCSLAWCDDSGRIRGDRALYQYADDFPGHPVVEGTLFPCYDDLPPLGPQRARLLLGETLGEAGKEFTRQAVDQLVAWGKSAYRSRDNAFLPMLTDGTSMEGYTCKKDGYFGPKGRILRAGHPGAPHLWLYALAYRMTGEPFLWEMVRNITRGNEWGDPGETAKSTPELQLPADVADPFLLVALLEMQRASGDVAYLDAAEKVGRNLLALRTRNGWFVRSPRHIRARLANDESQALLHLAARLLDRSDALPPFTGAEPFFRAEYGNSTGRAYDSTDLYDQARSESK